MLLHIIKKNTIATRYIIEYVCNHFLNHFFRCSSPSKLIGPRNVYNVSSATLTSYTSYSDGDSLDASLPNHLGLPVVKQKKSKTSLGTRAREKKILASIRNFLIVLALSIHSVFEGMAIGKDNSFLIFLRFDKFFLISGCVILRCALIDFWLLSKFSNRLIAS